MLPRVKGERLLGLDALRGIAALCVIAQHSLENVCLYGGSCWPGLPVINLGRFGVLLFFLISGFVIPPSIERGGLARFAINRAFRLLPALWVSIAVFLLFAASDGHFFGSADIVANMAMVARPLGRPEVEGVYWSLSYELGFYAFCAMLFAVGLLRNRSVVALVAIGASVIALRTSGEPWSFPPYLLVGMLARRLYDGEREVALWLAAAVLCLIFGVLAVSLSLHGNFLDPLPRIVASLLPLPFFAAVVKFRPDRAPAGIVWLGTISYSLYLFHWAALEMLKPSLSSLSYAYLPLVALATTGIAALTYRYIEKPAIDLGRRLLTQPMTRART
jgi:peptidoglycan/LPS O-acetylase OafA/YrhL